MCLDGNSGDSVMPPQKKLKVSSSPKLEDKNVEKREEKSTGDFGANWREQFTTNRQRNGYVLNQSILTDVTFEVGSEATPFQAHKLILALGSPVFEAMFYGGLAEKGDKILIPDIMPMGFKILLQYLYTEDVHFENVTEAFHTWFAADKYCVAHLKEQCNKFFTSCSLSTDNVWVILENSLFLNTTDVTKRCLEYLKWQTEPALSSDDFLGTSVEALESVLLLDSLNISELVLLKSLVHWGKMRVATQAAESLQEAIRPVLKHVRFGALTSLDFCLFLDESKDVLSDSDSLAIMKHITKPLSYPLPDWCCTKTWRRCHSFSNDTKLLERIRDGIKEHRAARHTESSSIGRDLQAPSTSRRRAATLSVEDSDTHSSDDDYSSSSSSSSTSSSSSWGSSHRPIDWDDDSE